MTATLGSDRKSATPRPRPRGFRRSRSQFGPVQRLGAGAVTAIAQSLRALPQSLPRLAAGLLAAAMLAIVVNLVVVSQFEHASAQHRLLDSFRNSLAQGTAPVGQTDTNNRLLALGTPVAIVRIPKLGVSEVVGEGTTSEVLTHGPGHLRATVLPGEVGTSQIFGRAAAYGGPFGGLGSLKRGATITTVDGIGESTYKVIDVRRAGDPQPPSLAAGGSRLTLLTADGTAFVPSGVLRVDADLVGSQAAQGALYPVTLAHSELAMATDFSTIWQMVLWLEALLVLAVGAALSWTRWGHGQTRIVFALPVVLVGYYIGDQTTRLLPNLL